MFMKAVLPAKLVVIPLWTNFSDWLQYRHHSLIAGVGLLYVFAPSLGLGELIPGVLQSRPVAGTSGGGVALGI